MNVYQWQTSPSYFLACMHVYFKTQFSLKHLWSLCWTAYKQKLLPDKCHFGIWILVEYWMFTNNINCLHIFLPHIKKTFLLWNIHKYWILFQTKCPRYHLSSNNFAFLIKVSWLTFEAKEVCEKKQLTDWKVVDFSLLPRVTQNKATLKAIFHKRQIYYTIQCMVT